MNIIDIGDTVEIVQQNRRGHGQIASRALRLAVGMGAAAAFLLMISTVLVQRSMMGEGAPEDIVGFLLIPPSALVFLIVVAFELSIVLPRRLRIDADGIHIRFYPWPLPRPKYLLRWPGQQAQVRKQRQVNYSTYPSGRVSAAPIVSHRFAIRYGAGWFGPVDEDQVALLADAINAALERTAPRE